MNACRCVRTMLLIAFALMATGAHADVVVGVVLSMSGPAAPVGRAQQRVVEHLPARIGNETVRYVLRDDGSDPGQARTVASALAASDGVDLVLGATTVAASMQIIDVLAPKGIPVITPSAVDLGRIHADAPSYWAFRTAPDTWLMANAVVAHLRAHDRQRIAFVALDGPFGEQWWSAFGTLAESRRLEVVSFRQFGADEANWQWPAAIAAEQPDAVMVVAAGSLAVTSVRSLRAEGYEGPIYQTNAAAVEAFRHACGGGCGGVMLPASPARLDDTYAAGRLFRERLGPAATSFGAYLWDAGLLFRAAAPKALAGATPGTAEFRLALRQALEHVSALEGVNGVFSMGPRDHVGLDQRAAIIVSPGKDGWITAD